MSEKENCKGLIIAIIIFSIIAIIAWGSLLPKIANTKDIKSEEHVNDLYASAESNETLEKERAKEDINDEEENGTQAKKEEIMQNIDEQYDDMQDITWYKAKGEPTYITNNQTESFIFQTYAGSKEGNYWLRLSTGFARSEWIFVEEIIIKADSNRFNVDFDVLQDRSGEAVYGNGIREWVDVEVDSNLLSNLKTIVSSNETKIRFQGRTDYTEFEINNSQKEQLKNIIEFYELVK